MASNYIENKLSLLPDLPGCYIMKDANKKIIYIGKAKNLKNRVRSYFKGHHEGKTARLVEEIADFEIIITETNKESLLLEINLIQKHQPYYNIMLKQGTMYPYLKITNEKDPQLIITSVVAKDGGRYFGPYPNIYAAKTTQDLLQKVFPLRKCGKNETRACFYYHIDQCIGCCDHEVSKEEYEAQIAKITDFLNGNVRDIKTALKDRMHKAAENMEFERAADYRDQIAGIETTVEKQHVMSKNYNNRDVFNFYYDKGWISIQVFFLRQYSIIKREASLYACFDDPIEELTSFIAQFYDHANHILPREIFVPAGVDTELLTEALGVRVFTPKRGDNKRILDMAYKNCRLAHNEKFRMLALDQKKTRGAVEELAEALGIPSANVIESFDHSNIQGTNPVSAMVVFDHGRPSRKNYRKYKIKTVEGSNEFATTQEVVRRRYGRLLREHQPLPDLILMDGAQIQVHAAKEVLEDELGLDIPVAGMVKDDRHKTHTLIFGDNLDPVILDPQSQAFHLVQRIQEEVHRFAITFHRQVRSKTSLASRLDAIDGVGPKTRTKLLKHFKTLKAIKEASIEELVAAGANRTVAANIQEGLNDEKPKPVPLPMPTPTTATPDDNRVTDE